MVVLSSVLHGAFAVKIFNRKPSLMLVLAVVMLGLLAALATLQYRWLGQISRAESERMKRTLSASASGFSQDFDREITMAFAMFQIPSVQNSSQEFAPLFAERFRLWKSSSSNPQLISDVFLVSKNDAGFQLSRFNSTELKLEPVEWTNTFKNIKTNIEKTFIKQTQFETEENLPPHELEGFDVIEPNLPALTIPVTHEFAMRIRMPMERVPFQPVSNFVIVKLNSDFIKNELIPNLSRKYFSGSTGLDYNVAILNEANSSFIYSSTAKEQKILGDAKMPLFRLRLEEIPPMFLLNLRHDNTDIKGTVTFESRTQKRSASVSNDVENKHQKQTISSNTTRDGEFKVRVINKSIGSDFTYQTIVEEPQQGYWTLVVQHRAGSLDAFVANARRQNLLISFGILLLLAASVTLIVIATRRSQILAQRQIEFVSSVSHEFRTPLAVICSAGENMADGIVESPKQVEKYGKLVLGEGRRLTEMVEQILEFAGANAKRRPLEVQLVSVRDVINDALQSCHPMLTEKDFNVKTKIDSDLPLIEADARSLSRAIQNLINNAIKYDDGECWLEIKVFADEKLNRKEVVISIADKGRGIAADELKNIFEPFYRGREAQAAQIHGNGLGLSLVKQTVAAHKGYVNVTSIAGKGSEFTIHLPIALTAANEEQVSIAGGSGHVGIQNSPHVTAGGTDSIR